MCVSAMDEISHTSIEQMYLLLWHKDLESSVYKDNVSKIKKQSMLTAVDSRLLVYMFPMISPTGTSGLGPGPVELSHCPPQELQSWPDLPSRPLSLGGAAGGHIGGEPLLAWLRGVGSTPDGLEQLTIKAAYDSKIK